MHYDKNIRKVPMKEILEEARRKLSYAMMYGKILIVNMGTSAGKNYKSPHSPRFEIELLHPVCSLIFISYTSLYIFNIMYAKSSIINFSEIQQFFYS